MFRDKLGLLKAKNTSEDGTNEKKKIENLVVFVIILIITVIAINLIWNDDKKTKDENQINVNSGQLASNSYDNSANELSFDLEKKLKNILQKIQGVGIVEVFINYSESSETVAMYNENSKVSSTEETDTSGGKRVIEQTDTQKDIIYEEDDGKKIPITQKIIQPKIEGAIITAEGAGNANIKANIVQAVEAATGLATHKIQVFEMDN